MPLQPGRNKNASPATVADGWRLERLTPPSRLSGANGIRTGADGRIYVAQVAGSKISVVDPDTGAIEDFVAAGAGITAPDDIVFDDQGNLYATEITEGRVSVRRPNGQTQVLFGDLPVANPITFHNGMLIAGELRMGGRIMELDRNGGAPRVIADGVPMANAFDVGPDGKLYFPAQAANEIWRVSLDGGAPEVVAKDLGVPDSVKFHPDGYIVSTQVVSGQVLKIDPRTGARELLADIGPGLDNVAFVNGRTFVSHIRGSIHEVVAPGSARALVESGFQWPMGIGVNSAGQVYVADGMFAYTIAPNGGATLAGTLFWPGYPGFMRGIAVDNAGAWIVSTASGTIARWNPGQEQEMLASGFEIPMGVAIAPNGAIVFVDAGSGRVLSLVGGVVSEMARGLDRPSGAAAAADGAVFVSLPDEGRIVSVLGAKTETIAEGLGRPDGIALRGDTLYAIDTLGRRLIEIDRARKTQRIIADCLPVGAPLGVPPLRLGGVGDMCGPMWSFTGLAAGADGALYLSADADGSVIALRPV